ncbi:MAG: hypothetical protein L6R36_000169 [Xanthoria steineri]|nr:MAG: hypothetical protein L6R36_000169 [Xanthoria steineri]
MPNNQNASSHSSSALDPDTLKAINNQLCDLDVARMLQDAGQASQKARNVSNQQPVRKPVVSGSNNGTAK